MTREQLIDAIWDNEDTWSCPKYNCDEPEEEGNTGECCKKCAEKQLEEYEKQIRAEERKKIMKIVDSADDNAQAMYLLGQYIITEELKEQK